MTPPPPPFEHPVNLAYMEYLDHYVRIPPKGWGGILRDSLILSSFIGLILFFHFNPTQRDTLLVILITIHLVQIIIRRKRRYVTHFDRATHWTAVPTYIVMGNNLLFKRGRNAVLPCLVLFTLDEDYGLNMAYMESLATRLYGLKETPQSAPQFEAYAEYVTDESAQFYRRRTLTRDFTGGPLVYACDLFVNRSMLFRGYVQQRWLPCVIQEGDEGGIEVVPWQALEIMNRRMQIANR